MQHCTDAAERCVDVRVGAWLVQDQDADQPRDGAVDTQLEDAPEAK